jgi:hypothetical protein
MSRCKLRTPYYFHFHNWFYYSKDLLLNSNETLISSIHCSNNTCKSLYNICSLLCVIWIISPASCNDTMASLNKLRYNWMFFIVCLFMYCCWRSSYQKGMVGIPLSSLTPLHFYTPVFKMGRIMIYQCPTVRPSVSHVSYMKVW